MSKIFCFGLGFTGNEIAKYFLLNKWSVTGTARNPIRDREKNIKLVKYDPINGNVDLTGELEQRIPSSFQFHQMTKEMWC